MKRSRTGLRGPRPNRPVQVFTCGPFEFAVDEALKLAASGPPRPERRWPNPDWIGPFIEIDEAYLV
jgi:hypothetical protein